MSLIYAERRDDLIYLLADTFWERPLISERSSWPSSPLVKLVSPKLGVVVAYAGNADWAERAIDQLFGANEQDVMNILFAAHQESLSKGNEVEFLAAFQNNMTLMQFKNGAAQMVTNAYLGSASNFSRFQSARHSEALNRDSETQIFMMMLPENCSQESCLRYSTALQSFQSTLHQPLDQECGGFCVPFILTPKSGTFMGYAELRRAAVHSLELGMDESGPIASRDIFNGQYMLSFGGNDIGFFAHFVDGCFAFLHGGFRSDRLLTRTLRGKDPYDLEEQLIRLGMPKGISTWRSNKRDASKLRELIEAGQLERAAAFLSDCAATLAKHLASKDQAKVLSFEMGFLRSPRDHESVNCSLDELNHLGFLIEAKYVLLSRIGDGQGAIDAQKELNSWRQFASQLRFQISTLNIDAYFSS